MDQSTDNDWQCDHDPLPVRRELSNGAIQYGTQCSRCGVWKAWKQSRFPLSAKFGQYDAAIRETWRIERYGLAEDNRKQQQVEESQRWWDIYRDFMASDAWRLYMQPAVMRRDGNTCQACLGKPAEHVHHVKYPANVASVKDFEKQPLFEMQAVCKTCHQNIHPNRKLR